MAEYLLRKPLGKSSKGVLSSATLLALLQEGCKTRTDVVALTPAALDAALGASAQEMTQYLAALLRQSLGHGSKAVLRDATLIALVRTGCRKKKDVERLSAQTINGLPAQAPQEMAEYRLRKPLGKAKGVLSSETLLEMLLAGSPRSSCPAHRGAAPPGNRGLLII